MNEFLVDTNVLSKVFKGDLAVTHFVENLEAVIDATIYIECLQGSKSQHEKQIIEKYLTRFPLLVITPQSSSTAIDLIRKYSNSHGLLLPDALIAASALVSDLTIVTFNVRDFKFIHELKILEPSV